MERERRYCMRFLRPYVSLEAIRVEITIQNLKNTFERDTIRYTLEESGYPDNPSSGTIKQYQQDLRTGQEELLFLQQKKRWDI
jgi:hypothetical protein